MGTEQKYKVSQSARLTAYKAVQNALLWTVLRSLDHEADEREVGYNLCVMEFWVVFLSPTGPSLVACPRVFCLYLTLVGCIFWRR